MAIDVLPSELTETDVYAIQNKSARRCQYKRSTQNALSFTIIMLLPMFSVAIVLCEQTLFALIMF